MLILLSKLRNIHSQTKISSNINTIMVHNLKYTTIIFMKKNTMSEYKTAYTNIYNI